MHQRQRARRELRQAADGRTHIRVERGILEQILSSDCGPTTNTVISITYVFAVLFRPARQQTIDRTLFLALIDLAASRAHADGSNLEAETPITRLALLVRRSLRLRSESSC